MVNGQGITGPAGTETKFATTGPLQVPTNPCTAVALHRTPGASDHVTSTGDDIVLRTEGWYEILTAVQWNPDDIPGTRFSHTKIPGQEPLHSEAINAAVLAPISEGRQLLRADTLFGPDRLPA